MDLLQIDRQLIGVDLLKVLRRVVGIAHHGTKLEQLQLLIVPVEVSQLH